MNSNVTEAIQYVTLDHKTSFELFFEIAFKVAQIKFLAMYITNQKWRFDIFTVQNIFMEHDLCLIS